MMTSRASLAVLASLSITSFGCSSSEFNESKAKAIIEARPVSLDAEQVTLSQAQVDCGVQAELWETPNQISPDRSTARLTSKGRELKVNDDVAVREPGYRQPYVQIRGDFMLQVDELTGIRDGEAKDTKLVDAKVGVKIQHACFPTPLPVMGVKSGRFRENAPASFRFRLSDDGWHLDKLVH